MPGDVVQVGIFFVEQEIGLHEIFQLYHLSTCELFAFVGHALSSAILPSRALIFKIETESFLKVALERNLSFRLLF